MSIRRYDWIELCAQGPVDAEWITVTDHLVAVTRAERDAHDVAIDDALSVVEALQTFASTGGNLYVLRSQVIERIERLLVDGGRTPSHLDTCSTCRDEVEADS